MRYALQWGSGHVRAIHDLTPSIREFLLEPAGEVVPYGPGSHINLNLLVAGQPEVRSYSLVGEAPVGGTYRIAVHRQDAGRGGSRYLWSLTPGAALGMSAPANLFALTLGRPRYLLIAGGIGITPMLGMAALLQQAGADFRMIYAGRSRADMAYVTDLENLLGDRLQLCLSDGGTRLVFEQEFAALSADAEVYLCGPLRMLEEARRVWQRLCRPAANLRFETFGSSGLFAREPFNVYVRDFGQTVAVPNDRSMLDALNDAGIPVMSDCLRGECGLCLVDVLGTNGMLDHRDVFLSEEQKLEGRQLCACVSRVAGGSVTIDTGFRPAHL